VADSLSCTVANMSERKRTETTVVRSIQCQRPMFLTSFLGFGRSVASSGPLLHLPPGDDKMIVLELRFFKSRRIQPPPFLEQRYRRGGSLMLPLCRKTYSAIFSRIGRWRKTLMPPRKPSSRLACCLCSGIRVLAAESAWALASDEALVKEWALVWRWLLVLE
jgi:hypothetical protein